MLDLGTQRPILGQGVCHGEPLTETKLLSLTQHEYARSLAGDTEFFQGKLLITEDMHNETQITGTNFTQLFEVEVDSTRGIDDGERVYYVDIQAGDDFVIQNWATLAVDEAGQWHVRGTDDVEMSLNGEKRSIPWSGQSN